MTELSGVRSSWLMLARNWLFVRLDSSAASLATRNASSAFLRAVMSCEMPKVPMMRPASSRKGSLVLKAQDTLPSGQVSRSSLVTVRPVCINACSSA